MQASKGAKVSALMLIFLALEFSAMTGQAEDKKSSSTSQVAAKKVSTGLPKTIGASGTTTFIYNPRTLRWGAYDSDGNLVKVGRGSGGRGYCPDIRRGCRTPQGTFQIISKGGASTKSTRYPLPRGGAPMPYAMFFTKYYAVHGSYEVPRYNASHGCVRVMPADARWLNTSFLKIGSKVIIYNY